MFAAIPFPEISPEIFSISLFGREFALRWYALAYMVGLLAGLAVIKALMRRANLWPDGTAPMKPEQVDDFLLWAVIGVIVGGRLGSVLFYSQGAYLADPLGILRVWEGGMSFHGGFLGVVLATFAYCRKNDVPLAALSDAVALVAPIGLFLGRIANFINGELWGRQTDLPWGVIFIEGQPARHPSQLYEAALEGLLLGLTLWILARRGAFKRPWLLTGTFFAGYGIARFLVEFVRQPDLQFVTETNPLGLYLQFGEFGLTAGQVLSLPMIAVGLVLISRSRRSKPA